MSTDIWRDFPVELARCRLSRGISLRELYRLSGVHFTMMNRFEAGKVRPSRTTLYRLATALDCQIIFDNSGIHVKWEEPNE